MFSKKLRDYNDNICDYSSKEFNFNDLINNKSILTCDDDNIVIWYDASINKDQQDDQYSFSQLHLVHKSIVIFTIEQECLEFINNFRDKNKLFLIVSGSLGRNFVPKICHLSQINSIYIFCGKKSVHESWANKYEKIKGVFDKITELCEHLKHDKQKLEQTELCRKLIDSFVKKSSSLQAFDELLTIKNSIHDDQHQPKDDIKTIVKSADIPFSKEESCSPIKDMECSNNIDSSETVAPYTQYKQQMEFSDTGIWPCISVIDSARNDLVNHLHSAIETVKYFNSTEKFLQHINTHPVDPHLIVLSNPTNIEDLNLLIHSRVRSVYIYCSNNRLNEYNVWIERYSHIVSVLQHFHTLTRMILWDLSACIVDIGNYYASVNKKSLAQTRYLYAYRLHVIVQGDLNNRMEMMECTQPIKFNN